MRKVGFGAWCRRAKFQCWVKLNPRSPRNVQHLKAVNSTLVGEVVRQVVSCGHPTVDSQRWQRLQTKQQTSLDANSFFPPWRRNSRVRSMTQRVVGRLMDSTVWRRQITRTYESVTSLSITATKSTMQKFRGLYDLNFNAQSPGRRSTWTHRSDIRRMSPAE